MVESSAHIAVCGAGTMGTGIAFLCARAGWKTTLYDPLESARERAIGIVGEIMLKPLQQGTLPESEAAAIVKRFATTDNLAALDDCDVAIEAIIEDKQAKISLFSALEETLPSTAILASNTSSLSINALAAPLKYKERFIGMHFFNPAHIMKLVEIIRGIKTSPETVEIALDFVARLGKTAVEAKDVPGFIVNRVARNYYLEAMRIVSEGGATVPQIDALMRSAGFKMGPFELVDLIGVDINFAVSRSVWEQYFYEPRFAPSLLQKQYVDAGLWGRKTGEGFYRYDAKGRKLE
jgi:3-hydroxybutyryl-CoA dehydrogenase